MWKKAHVRIPSRMNLGFLYGPAFHYPFTCAPLSRCIPKEEVMLLWWPLLGNLLVFYPIAQVTAIHLKICYREISSTDTVASHDGVIKWKHFPRYRPFLRGIHRSPVNSLHKGQWRGALMFSLICVWINDWVNNRKTGILRRYRAHYDVTVMTPVAILTTHCSLRDAVVFSNL